METRHRAKAGHERRQAEGQAGGGADHDYATRLALTNALLLVDLRQRQLRAAVATYREVREHAIETGP
ncbi:MAG: hypothetical protein Q8O42_15415 [Acidobacteriota bacterium]|nr:hypothetical protein [Acidobacteriota bacterium]